MRNRERFLNCLNFKKPEDRLPMVEWAVRWNKTLDRWRSEGLPSDFGSNETSEYLGLDMLRQFWLAAKGSNYPVMERGQGPVSDSLSYGRIKEFLYPADTVEKIRNRLIELKPLHQNGDVVIWISLEGFFWFPRQLFGIERHFYMFYDDPELMHRINRDLAEYNIFLIEEFCKILKPDFMSFAEDMSYNHGPMLSYKLFRGLLLPYYKKVMPVLKKHNIITFIDSDGQVEEMIPWFIEAGIEGVFPLERQAGVDVVRIRRKFPDFKMIGAYDKMVMSKGEEAMQQEFERLLPVMKSGGFIPSCDHQTPPEVSLENYKIYIKLMKEYCEKAVY
jgi:uroporphyrinogen-III decarboxylase